MDGALLGILKKSMNSGIGSSSVTALDTKIDNLSNKIGTQNNQVFTSSGTFNVPSGVTKIYVTACAGGGGGAGGGKYASSTNITAYSGAGGNGGEFVYRYPITVTPGSSISITVGSGGSGGSGSSTKYSWAGGTGENTIIGSYLTLTGGAGGVQNPGTSDVFNSQTVSTTNGGTGCNGSYVYSGTSYTPNPVGHNKSIYHSGYIGRYTSVGCDGTDNSEGGSSLGSCPPINGGAGIYGSGGHGGYYMASSSSGSYGSAGGTGGSGICIIEWGDVL